MPSFDGLLIVMAVAFAVPFVLGLVQRVRVPSIVLEIVVGIAIGLELGVLDGAQGAALVGAGLLSVLLFPAAGLSLLRGGRADEPSGFPYFTCQQMVELVTDHLEDRLGIYDRLRFEQHVAVCGPCRAYLAQMRETIRMTGELREGDVPADARGHLLQTFREWNAGR